MNTSETSLEDDSLKRFKPKTSEDFESDELYEKYNVLIESSQDCYCARDFQKARRLAVEALKILPTPQLFNLCAAIEDALGNYDRAADFRLLQAFQANDKILWGELLTEFLERNLWYRASLCVKRLAMLAEPGSPERRELLLQLADLYMTLEEHHSAIRIYQNLWATSGCRDFAVFATLSSTFFQLGKWRNLEMLIESSAAVFLRGQFKNSLRRQFGDKPEDSNSVKNGRGEAGSGASLFNTLFKQKKANARPSKRPASDDAAAEVSTDGTFDDFSFENLDAFPLPLGEEEGEGQDPWIELTSDSEIEGYICLINVYSELLLERGLYEECANLICRAARHLGKDLKEIIPDLFLKYTIATTFLGADAEEINDCVNHLVSSVDPHIYGDVLYDGAQALLKAGVFTAAEKIFRRLYDFYHSQIRDGEEGEDSEEDRTQRDVALLFGIAKCAAATVPFAPYVTRARRAFAASSSGTSIDTTRKPLISQDQHPSLAALLEIYNRLDPFHAPTRVMLSELYRVHYRNYDAAEEVLQTPVLKPEQIEAQRRKLARIGISSKFLTEELLRRQEEASRESGFQRAECDVALMYLYANTPVNRYLDALNVGVPLMRTLLNSLDEENDENADRMSIATGTSNGGGAGQRGRRMFIPSMTRSSSAIIPVSRLAGSLAGDETGTSILGSVYSGGTRSIATSFRAHQSEGTVLLSKRGVSASGSVIASSATTALSIKAASRAGSHMSTKSATITSGIDNERLNNDPTGIFQFHKRGKKKRLDHDKTEKRTHTTQDGEGAGQSSERNVKKVSGGDDEDDEWETASVGNLHSLEDIEALELESKEKEVAPEGKKRACITFGDEEEHVIVPKQNPDEYDERNWDTLPSIEEVISKNFSVDSQMAELFRAVTTGGEDEEETDNKGTASAATCPPDIGQQVLPGVSPAAAVPMAPAAAALASAAPLVTSSAHDRPFTMREFVSLYSRRSLINLAITIVYCYDSLDDHLDAKDFISEFIKKTSKPIFRRCEGLLVPLRVAMIRQTLLSGHSEDTIRIVTGLLQREGRASSAAYSMFDIFDASASTTANLPHESALLMSKSNESDGSFSMQSASSVAAATVREMWEAISSLVNNGMKSGILKRLIKDRGCMEYELLCIEGNSSYRTGAFKRSLNLYFIALLQKPTDPLLLMQISLCYMQLSHNRRLSKDKGEMVDASMYFMYRYVLAVMKAETEGLQDDNDGSKTEESWDVSHGESGMPPADEKIGSPYIPFIESTLLNSESLTSSPRLTESLYNVARLYQYYSLNYLAVPIYRRVIELAKMQLTSRGPMGSDEQWNHVIQWITAIKRAALYNLAYIYGRYGKNDILRLETLPRLDE